MHDIVTADPILMDKTVLLVVCGSNSRRYPLQSLKLAGVRCICVNGTEVPWATEEGLVSDWILGDISNHKEILDKVGEYLRDRDVSFDAVLCYDEFGVHLASELSAYLRLPFTPSATVADVRNKYIFRQRCQAKGVKGPKMFKLELDLDMFREFRLRSDFRKTTQRRSCCQNLDDVCSRCQVLYWAFSWDEGKGIMAENAKGEEEKVEGGNVERNVHLSKTGLDNYDPKSMGSQGGSNSRKYNEQGANEQEERDSGQGYENNNYDSEEEKAEEQESISSFTQKDTAHGHWETLAQEADKDETSLLMDPSKKIIDEQSPEQLHTVSFNPLMLMRRRLEAMFAEAGVTFPVVVKPTHGAGKMFVRRVTNFIELVDIIYNFVVYNMDYMERFYLTASEAAGIFVEEFIPGFEVDIDCLVQNVSIT